MSLKIKCENIVTDIITRDIKEHSVELDYILPDYYPEIFRIIRCTAVPSVISSSMNGNRLSYEVRVTLKIIYCAAGNIIRTIEKKLDFSGGADLPDEMGTGGAARIAPKADYISCRAVTGRRIDVRGQISVSICVVSEKPCPVVSEASGDGILLKRESISCLSPRIYSEKRITVSEDMELGTEKPSAAEILRSSAAVLTSEYKSVADKLAVKGDIRVNMIYISSENKDAIESMQFTVPYSQIMDMDGLDERYDVKIRVFAENAEVYPKSDGSGDSKTVECAVTLYIACTAEKYSVYELAADEFSTVAPSSHKTEEIKLPCVNVPVSESRTVKGEASDHEGTVDTVIDSWCELNSFNFIKEENGSVSAVGKAVLCAMIRSSAGEIKVLACDAPFRFENIGGKTNLSDNYFCDMDFFPLSSSYNLTSDNTIELTGEIKLAGEIKDYKCVPLISEITVNKDEKKNPGEPYSVKLYFASKGEDLWETAKRCGTSPQAILEENGLESEITENAGLIIIPIVSKG